MGCERNGGEPKMEAIFRIEDNRGSLVKIQ